MTVTVGIDVGLTGAVAAVRDGHQLIYIGDLPVMVRDKAGKKQISGSGFAQMVREIVELCPQEHISFCIEHTNARPQQASSTIFSMGHSLGIIEGVLCGKRQSIHFVKPAVWKKRMGFNDDKNYSRSRMQLMFPGAELHLVKHHDRAEAMALAVYHYQDFYGQGDFK